MSHKRDPAGASKSHRQSGLRREHTSFATFGAGFWAQFQLSAWRELPNNKVRGNQQPHPIEGRSVGQTHGNRWRVFGPGHENFRWQEPIRAAARLLKAGVIGDAFRARVDFISGFPVFDNQPALNTMDPFILMDLGTHVLDVARFLFGEASRVYCQTQRIHTDALGTTDVMYVCGGGIFAPSLRRSWEAPACSADAAKSFLALFWEQSSFRPLRPGWSSSTSTLTCIR